uniref:Uncharacterized protein n=1 Tax=Avena sativa TaxID=4498 RepID=A0ACD5WJC9_AVESA
MRVCLPSLGADQFAHEDPSEPRQQSSFFNWYSFGISFGGFIGLVLVVWLENYKVVLRVLPLFINSIIGYMPAGHHPLHLHRAAGRHEGHEAGRDPRLPGHALRRPRRVMDATLAVYDRFLVPLLRRRTGYASGVTHLQRVGVGFAAVTLASAVERKRKEGVEQQRRMSLFWLAPQFLLLGVSDVTSITGLLEFLSSEVPRGMKSIATALFWCDLGLRPRVAGGNARGGGRDVNAARRRGRQQGGWLAVGREPGRGTA